MRKHETFSYFWWLLGFLLSSKHFLGCFLWFSLSLSHWYDCSILMGFCRKLNFMVFVCCCRWASIWFYCLYRGKFWYVKKLFVEEIIIYWLLWNDRSQIIWFTPCQWLFMLLVCSVKHSRRSHFTREGYWKISSQLWNGALLARLQLVFTRQLLYWRISRRAAFTVSPVRFLHFSFTSVSL